MNHREFRAFQRKLDESGLLTCITRIGTGKNRNYDVIVNGEVKRNYKQRRSAKNYLVRLYEDRN